MSNVWSICDAKNWIFNALGSVELNEAEHEGRECSKLSEALNVHSRLVAST